MVIGPAAIFGSYYLFEALLMLSGRLQPSEV